MHPPVLNLHGRVLLLVVSEIMANAVCWLIAGLLFGPNKDTQPILSLAVLAWTLGLRHGLDADHICAIDNATRGLISLGQLPVTCGLFFSLGHSTIVIIVIVAIAVSTTVYERLADVGSIGSIIGPAVSGSFLFIVAVANSTILYRIMKQRRVGARSSIGDGPSVADKHNRTLLMRLIGPVISFVDRPWKMFPVGFLFGLGFDTASSIALLAIAAVAKTSSNMESDSRGKVRKPSDIIVLPLLFTAGMTLVDSLDSVLMLYSYAGFPSVRNRDREIRWWTAFIDSSLPVLHDHNEGAAPQLGTEWPETVDSSLGEVLNEDGRRLAGPAQISPPLNAVDPTSHAITQAKMNVMSTLSIILTVLSILVAFAISIITIMGLIGEQCSPCRDAAENDDGLSGRWWRGWGKANDNSGFIGAAIVGVFVLIIVLWYGGRKISRMRGTSGS